MDRTTDRFTELVKDALEHLYDPARLREHPLTSLLAPEPLPLGIGPAQALRQVLLDGIERLNFSAALPPSAKQNRAHQILVLRYVEALPFREVMAELSLSQPQFHREQRHAVEALASLLEEQYRAVADPPPAAESDRSFADLDALAQRGDVPVDLSEVLQGVARMMTDVAASVGVTLRVEESPSGVALANRTALRQLLIGLVGYVLCAATGGELSLRVVAAGDLTLCAAYRGEVDRLALDRAEARDRFAVVARLVAARRGTLASTPGDGSLAVVAHLPSARRTLLVVDDNPDLIQLATRLLADQPYTVVGADSVSAGLALARDARPDLILLDIMMPEQDGWDALQILKHDPATQEIPVLVCTVLAEARLALALGAAEFIRKPLTRPRLLEALARWTSLPRPTTPRSTEEANRGSIGSGPPAD